MRVRNVLLVLAVFFSGPQYAQANPVMIHYLSELRFTRTGWELELTPEDGLEGCWITSRSDTAFLHPTVPYEDYVVITADSLQSPLFIDPAGDSLALYIPPNMQHPGDLLVFGDYPGARIPAPPPGCSISIRRWEDFYYFDASPTLGAPNDTTNAMGDIDGVVTNTDGDALIGAKVIYDYNDLGGEIYVLTDSAGHFLIHDFARPEYLWVVAEGCTDHGMRIQIWPDSTVVLTVILECEVGTNEYPLRPSASVYLLFQNNPNPFSSATTIAYSIPRTEFMRMSIFDLKGNLIEKLLEKSLPAGLHRVTWQPQGIPAGTYLYTLQTPGSQLTRRCQFLK